MKRDMTAGLALLLAVGMLAMADVAVAGDDDAIVGGWGQDWISGGTGRDSSGGGTKPGGYGNDLMSADDTLR